MAATGIDLSTMEFWARPAAEREHAFAALRAQAPVTWQRPVEDIFGIPAVEGDGYWAITRHEDIRRISRDPQTYCSGQGVMFGDAPPEFLEMSMSFLASDAPRHTLLRGLVSSAFTPRQVRRIEDGIRADARTVVDELLPTGGGDFVSLVAKRLPLMTIAAMVGVPDAERDAYVEHADALVSVADPDYLAGRDPLAVLGTALWELTQAATEIAAHRETHPADDLMTALVQARVDGQRLTHAEIGAFFVLLAVAGNDTTRHTTPHAMRALQEHPEQRALLAEDPEARLPVAVEEFVRWATPVMTFRRTATRPVSVHGQEIEAGQKVVLFYTSGNRDETAFEEPNRFDVTRDPNRHLGFGGGGPHYCLGASLARTQLRAVFGELLGRVPDLEVGEPEPLVGAFIHGVKRMDCSFAPSA